ncbi:hypothetical protein KIPB_008760 [Kipferlia bialata]|uniref:Uncharacterized protein n=1 Tax=Kipferlia bialata TaxID=797122 RepID=A0A9K3GKZ5_9EUKA|nr:hypothetical protein KIPB_008760 [Kipferlia bialata]|eukprot:g8760.t1
MYRRRSGGQPRTRPRPLASDTPPRVYDEGEEVEDAVEDPIDDEPTAPPGRPTFNTRRGGYSDSHRQGGQRGGASGASGGGRRGSDSFEALMGEVMDRVEDPLAQGEYEGEGEGGYQERRGRGRGRDTGYRTRGGSGGDSFDQLMGDVYGESDRRPLMRQRARRPRVQIEEPDLIEESEEDMGPPVMRPMAQSQFPTVPVHPRPRPVPRPLPTDTPRREGGFSTLDTQIEETPGLADYPVPVTNRRERGMHSMSVIEEFDLDPVTPPRPRDGEAATQGYIPASYPMEEGEGEGSPGVHPPPATNMGDDYVPASYGQGGMAPMDTDMADPIEESVIDQPGGDAHGDWGQNVSQRDGSQSVIESFGDDVYPNGDVPQVVRVAQTPRVVMPMPVPKSARRRQDGSTDTSMATVLKARQQKREAVTRRKGLLKKGSTPVGPLLSLLALSRDMAHQAQEEREREGQAASGPVGGGITLVINRIAFLLRCTIVQGSDSMGRDHVVLIRDSEAFPKRELSHLTLNKRVTITSPSQSMSVPLFSGAERRQRFLTRLYTAVDWPLSGVSRVESVLVGVTSLVPVPQ